MKKKCEHFLINENCEACKEIQDKWYDQLRKKGFEDIEERKFNLLKKWTGISQSFDIGFIQEANEEIQSSWPETNFKKEEEFLNHPNFRGICENIFKHKNNSLKPYQIMQAWADHCEGYSSREIAKKYKISPFCGWYIINKLKELMKIMDLDQEKVIIREYDSINDAPFLFATWRKSIWFETYSEKDPLDPSFFRRKTKEIRSIIENKNTKVKIACLNTDQDQIIGYSVITDLTLEFVYVKLDYRKQKIATLLTKGFNSVVKPLTKIGASIVKEHKLRIKGEKEDETRRTVSQHRNRSKEEFKV